jgi:2'-5' RNA ligase
MFDIFSYAVMFVMVLATEIQQTIEMKSVHINNNHWNTLTNIRHHMFEYLLVFSCDKLTEALVHNVKRYFEENYGCRQALSLVSHRSLFYCIIHENKAERLVQGFEKVARNMQPFKVSFTSFEQYEQGTFYIDLENGASRQVLDMVRKLRGEVSAHVKQWAPAEYKFCDDPHITVARNMSPWQVQRATSDWLHKDFDASFEAQEMVLLRRTLVDGARYETVARFPLLGLPEGQFVQASLF